MFDRYTINTSQKNLEKRFGITHADGFNKTFNAYPTKLLPVIINEGTRGLSFFYWGQTPEWSHNKNLSTRLFNAPFDQISTKTSYRNTLKARRCLIPATGFYLWKRVGKKTRIPQYYYLKKRKLFSVAGLWETYTTIDEQNYHIFSAITVSPNAGIGEFCDDMPAILNQNEEEGWLHSDNPEDSLRLLKTTPADELVCYAVGPKILSKTQDDESLIKVSQPLDQHGNYTLFS